MDDFEEHVQALIARALESVSPEEARDAYVVSLFVYDEEDDPRYPTITVGFNTETQVTATAGEAEDEDEARWNFAFWLQNELVVIADSERDPDGAALRRAWLEREGLWYEEDDDDEGEDADITGAFVAMAVRIVQRLHAGGLIEGVFGHAIPVLIHELEYYDEIAQQNRDANPDGLADEFSAWIAAM